MTSAHPPFDIRVFHKECKTLAATGYQVVLVVPCDTAALVDGVAIRTIPLPNSRSDRMFRTVWRVFRAAVAERADLYHFHDAELLPVGVMLKAYGKAVIYDAHEDVPEDIKDKAYLPAAIRPALSWAVGSIEKLSSRLFDGVVSATPAIARRFPARNSVTVQNFPLTADLPNGCSLAYRDRPMVAAYTGAMTDVRGIRQMLQAMSLLPDTLDARLLLAATFSPRELKGQVQQYEGWKRVEFVEWKPPAEIPKLVAGTRMGLVLYHPLGNHMEAQPHKLFEYMSAALPIVASNFPLWRKLIETTGCGLTVDPLNPNDIASAMRWLFEHPNEAERMGERGRQAVQSRFNWSNEASVLLRFYQRILTRKTDLLSKVA